MNHHHVALRRLTSLIAVAVGLGIGGALPIAGLADAASSAQPARHSQPDGQKDRGLIRFAAGSMSGSVNGAVARGDWEHWGARAQRGQTIDVTVSAPAGNATFELYTPAGDQMADDVTSFRGQLPASGLYAIDVGSTGGLAHYTVDVTIAGEPAAPPPRPSGGSHFRGRIQIAASAQAGSASGTVARGDWHEWSFRATGGQTAIVRVTSAAGNSTLSLYAPNGDVLAAHTKSFTGRLPATGLYMIEVGSTGGTTNYMVDVAFDGSAPSPPSPAPDPAPSHFQGNIRFAAGASSGSVGGTVEAGNWHEWSFKAFAGQSMTLTVAASGGSATFSLYEPDGDAIAAHTTSFSGTVPATGFYMIEVGPAGGGNPSYQLNLRIT